MYNTFYIQSSSKIQDVEAPKVHVSQSSLHPSMLVVINQNKIFSRSNKHLIDSRQAVKHSEMPEDISITKTIQEPYPDSAIKQNEDK
jgi:hypothetical protein